MSSIVDYIAGFFNSAPNQTQEFNGYDVSTYNYSGGRIPNMTAIGTPSSVPLPDLPTSIPSDNSGGDESVNYYEPAVKMSAIGLTSSQITLNVPTTADNPVQQAGADTAVLPECSFCNLITNSLLGGTLQPAPTAASNSAAQQKANS
jgi:hypothetical protein